MTNTYPTFLPDEGDVGVVGGLVQGVGGVFVGQVGQSRHVGQLQGAGVVVIAGGRVGHVGHVTGVGQVGSDSTEIKAHYVIVLS